MFILRWKWKLILPRNPRQWWKSSSSSSAWCWVSSSWPLSSGVYGRSIIGHCVYIHICCRSPPVCPLIRPSCPVSFSGWFLQERLWEEEGRVQQRQLGLRSETRQRELYLTTPITSGFDLMDARAKGRRVGCCETCDVLNCTWTSQANERPVKCCQVVSAINVLWPDSAPDWCDWLIDVTSNTHKREDAANEKGSKPACPVRRPLASWRVTSCEGHGWWGHVSQSSRNVLVTMGDRNVPSEQLWRTFGLYFSVHWCSPAGRHVHGCFYFDMCDQGHRETRQACPVAAVTWLRLLWVLTILITSHLHMDHHMIG